MPSPRNPRRSDASDNEPKRSPNPNNQRRCNDMRKRAGSQPGFDVTIPVFATTNQQPNSRNPNCDMRKRGASQPGFDVTIPLFTKTNQLQMAPRPANSPISTNIPQKPLHFATNVNSHSPISVIPTSNHASIRNQSTKVHPGSPKDTIQTTANYTIASGADSLLSNFFENHASASGKSTPSNLPPRGSFGDESLNRSNTSNIKRTRPSSSPPHQTSRHPSQFSNSSSVRPARPASAASAVQPLMTPVPSVTQPTNRSQASSASIPIHRNVASKISTATSTRSRNNSSGNGAIQDRYLPAEAIVASLSRNESVISKEDRKVSSRATVASSYQTCDNFSTSSYFTALTSEALPKSKNK